MPAEPAPSPRPRWWHRGEAAALTRQTWIAASAAVSFVVLSLVIALMPIPFVTETPGEGYDLFGQAPSGAPVVQVANLPTYPTSGRLLLLTVAESAPEARVSLPEALLAHWLPRRAVLPRDVVYPAGQPAAQSQQVDAQLMDSSQQDAIVAALREAGVEIKVLPMVASVSANGPASGLLRPGDFVVKVDGKAVTGLDEIGTAIAAKHVGDKVTLGIVRESKPVDVSVLLGAAANGGRPIVGAEFRLGYTYGASVHYNVDPAIGGPSGGLMFALALYDRITASNLTAGRVIAGTGTIGVDGSVGPIGGLQQKLSAAERAGASILLVPAANCPDLSGTTTSLRLVRVTSLSQAIVALEELRNPTTAEDVPSCR